VDNDEDFQRWLRQRLGERGISQRQLAYRAGVDHTTVSRLLAGTRQPSRGTARRLAQVLESRSGLDAVAAILRNDPALMERDVARIMSVYAAIRAARTRDDMRRAAPSVDCAADGDRDAADAHVCPTCQQVRGWHNGPVSRSL
jgi:transcriptional regulator with XRE-family HTH domain